MTKNYNTCICTHSHTCIFTCANDSLQNTSRFDAMRCDSADDVGRVMKPPSFQRTLSPLPQSTKCWIEFIRFKRQMEIVGPPFCVLCRRQTTFFVYKFIIIFSVEYLLQLLLYFSFANIKAKFLFQYAYIYIHTCTHTYKYVYMFVSMILSE